VRKLTTLTAVLMAGIFAVALPGNGAQTLGKPEGLKFMLLEGQVPLERVLVSSDGTIEIRPRNTWACDNPYCAEGCNSEAPYWGNGLILEERRRLQGQ